MLYFAYGSNLNQKQMQARCPGSIFLSLGYLKNYKLYYGGTCKDWDNQAYADIEKSPGDLVWGALYEVSKINVKKLDAFENVPKDYTHHAVHIKTGHSTKNAYTYIGPMLKAAKPSFKYRHAILIGAKSLHLPKTYIAKSI